MGSSSNPGGTNPKSTTKRTTPVKKTTKPGDTSGTDNHTVKIESPRLSLMYKVEQLQRSGGTVEVDPDKVFKTGDEIRLRIGVNVDSYVYLITQGSSGEWSILFPQTGEDNHLTAFQPVQVPAEPNDPIFFDETAGAETLYIRVSRTPILDLQQLLPQKSGQGPKLMAAVPKSQIDDMFKRERMEARDMKRGKYHPVETPNPEDKNEWAIYVANVSTDPGSEVIQKFQLRHK